MNKEQAINKASRTSKEVLYVIYEPETYRDIFSNAGYRVVDHNYILSMNCDSSIVYKTVFRI